MTSVDERLAALEGQIAEIRAEYDALLTAVGASLRRIGVRVRPIASLTPEELEGRVVAAKSEIAARPFFASGRPTDAALRVALLCGRSRGRAIEPLPVADVVAHFEGAARRAYPGAPDPAGQRYHAADQTAALEDAIDLGHSSTIASEPDATEPEVTDPAEAAKRLLERRVRWDGTDISAGWERRLEAARTPRAARPEAWQGVADDVWEFVVLSAIANPFAVPLGRPVRPPWKDGATVTDVIAAERGRRRQ